MAPSELLRLPHARISDAAELAGVCRRTVERWIEQGTVRAFKVGRARHVILDDLPVQLEVEKRPRPRAGRRADERARKDFVREALKDF